MVIISVAIVRNILPRDLLTSLLQAPPHRRDNEASRLASGVSSAIQRLPVSKYGTITRVLTSFTYAQVLDDYSRLWLIPQMDRLYRCLTFQFNLHLLVT